MKALVIGLGQSGEWAARLLRSRGAQVLVQDRTESPALAARAAALSEAGIEVRLGCAPTPGAALDLCVLSPGIPLDSPGVLALRACGIPVVSELELAWRHSRGRILAITGSAGKSTLAKLCCETLRAAGLRAALGGNYGPPLSRLVLEAADAEWLVVEASSFQLESVHAFCPRIGVLLNLHPNHLDRHRTMAAYERAKARLVSGMHGEGTVIVGSGVRGRLRRRLRELGVADGPAVWWTVGLSNKADYRYADGYVSVPAPDARAGQGGRSRIRVAGTWFDNPVLGVAAAAAAAVTASCGLPFEALARALARFEPLPHRMQPAGEVRGVRFVDDSKATTLSALRAALQMSGERVRLIAGGRLKERKLGVPKKELAKKVDAVYLIGESASVLAETWGTVVRCRVCGNLRDAVRRAWTDARAGDVVLLAPGCASFDQFRGYEDRGEQFCRLVGGLAGEEETEA